MNEKISEDMHAVGSYNLIQKITLLIKEAFINSELNFDRHFHVYHRLLKGGQIYAAKSYQRACKTVSYFVNYLYGPHCQKCIGLINSFVKWSDCKCKAVCTCAGEHVAIISAYAANDGLIKNRVAGNFVFQRIEPLNITFSVDVKYIVSLLIYIAVGDAEYVVNPVNSLECE